MKCCNCNSEALFEYRITLNKSIFYCNKDLPSFLDDRKRAGLLKVTDKFEESVAEATTELKTKTDSEPSKPVKKKAVKKKAE